MNETLERRLLVRQSASPKARLLDLDGLCAYQDGWNAALDAIVGKP